MSSKKAKTDAETKVDKQEADKTPSAPVVPPMPDPFGFGDLFHWPPSRFGRSWPELFRDESDHIKVEEFVVDDELHVRAELPGIDADKDIDITVDKGRLSISAERERRSESTENGYRSEFRYGSFTRVIALPDGVDADDVTASYDDGILDVRIPIDLTGTKARKVSISH